jgi:tetratricopeptide (TPR) repeat protein
MNVRWVFAAFLLTAPAFASFRCPARGGAPWREYRSAHFLIDTDARAGEAQSLVRQLEHTQALVLQALVGEQVDIPGRVRVLAFADQTDFTEMAGEVVSGYYARGLFGEPSIVLPLRLLSNDPEVVAHELAHHLSFFLFPVQPHWFSEGLAEWVQTVASRPADKAMLRTGSHIARGINAMSGAMAGSIPLNLVSWLSYDARPMPTRELFTWDGSETTTSGARGHLWSWMLYHWLWNQRGKAFAEYQKRLAESGDPEAAWRGAFPEFDPSSPEALAKLDEELDRYRTGGRFAFYKVEAQADARFNEAAISSSELHLLLLGLRRSWPRETDRQKAIRRGILDEAVAEDPGNPMALYTQMTVLEKVDVGALRAAVKARPADWRGWLALGQAAPAAEREAALRKAVELNPQSASAQNALAWLLVTSDRVRDALPIANRALDLAPWDANIVDTLAEVAARLGKCPEALQLEKRAVATAPSDRMRKRQAEIEQRCSGPK